MCRAYLIKPNAGWERHHAPELEAAHSAALPSMICDRCGAWALTGIQYPSIDVIALQREFGRLEPSAVSLAEFSTLKFRVARFFLRLNKKFSLEPASVLSGKARGEFGDFAWLNPWTVLVRESVVKKLQLAHIRVVAIKGKLDFQSDGQQPLFEIEALPAVRLAQSLVPGRCEICGRLPIRAPKKIVLALDPTMARDQYKEYPSYPPI